jgi:uncharacterized protein (DUF2132 family)
MDGRMITGPESSMTNQHPKDPLHGVTLEAMLTQLVKHYGWPEMGRLIKIRCFNFDPSIKSSLQFLRRTPWARAKVEAFYLRYAKHVTKQEANPPD